MTKVYRVSASLFVRWATQRSTKHRVIGLIEHYAHHQAVLKYQSPKLTTPQVTLSDKENWFENEGMPIALRQAKIEKSESDIACRFSDFHLLGRVDQFYLVKNIGVLVDTKSHAKPTFKDQLQLSFYAFILQQNGYKIADYAYVRCANNVDVSYQEIDLLPLDLMKEIIELM